MSPAAIFVFFSFFPFSVFFFLFPFFGGEKGKRKKSCYPKFYERKTKRETNKKGSNTKHKIRSTNLSFAGTFWALVPFYLNLSLSWRSLGLVKPHTLKWSSRAWIRYKIVCALKNKKVLCFFFFLNELDSCKMSLLWNIYRDIIFLMD